MLFQCCFCHCMCVSITITLELNLPCLLTSDILTIEMHPSPYSISILHLFLTIILPTFLSIFNQKICSRTITILIQTIIVFPSINPNSVACPFLLG